MHTSLAGLNRPCSRIQRRRARATSARSCSAARRLFFERDLVPLEEPPDRRTTARNFELTHHPDDLVQRQVGLQFNQCQQKVRVLLQRRHAPTAGLGGTAASLAKALHPDHRRTGAHFVVLGCLPPRSTAFYAIDYPLAHVRGVCPRHRPASQSRINDERLTHLRAKGNPPDSITPELALATEPFYRAAARSPQRQREQTTTNSIGLNGVGTRNTESCTTSATFGTLPFISAPSRSGLARRFRRAMTCPSPYPIGYAYSFVSSTNQWQMHRDRTISFAKNKGEQICERRMLRLSWQP